MNDCKLGEPMMHGPQPYRWCETHGRLMLACDDEFRADCDNCVQDNKQTKATITLGDGMRLCADCCAELNDLMEPVEAGA